MASLRLALAASWLGSGTQRPAARLLKKLTQDAAAHPAASVRATAAVLLPASLAAVAVSAASGLSQVHHTIEHAHISLDADSGIAYAPTPIYSIDSLFPSTAPYF